MSLAHEPAIKTWVHLDERSAAYFTLGISRALNEPAAVISTSGTAAANFFPAVVEAHYSHVPMLIVTADRPPELWEWGANQTIDQSRMYGSHAKWSVNVAPPEVTVDLLRYVREITCRLLSTAAQSPAGPVHVNFPFREPLVPERIPSDIPDNLRGDKDDWVGREQGRPYTIVASGYRSIDARKIKELARVLGAVKSGLIVCGPQNDSSFAVAVPNLARRLTFPILADPLSQVRCGPHDRSFVIDSYDAFLRSKKIVEALAPELVLRFGATPTSKPLQAYIAKHHAARQILISEGDWQDPMHTATDTFQTNPNQFVTELTAALGASSNNEWANQWLAISAEAHKIILNQASKIEEMFEGKVFVELADLLPAKTTLFAGNSMPVRDLDTFFPSVPKQTRFLANRGASGIDGVLSTALGTSAAIQDPTVLVLGDLSFYHDMNGLLAAKQYGLNTTIVLVNNNGGGIFSFLPQREFPETFEKYFATPHGLTFQAAALLYGLTYAKASSWQEFRIAVSGNMNQLRTAIVEVQTDRERNVELHRRISSAVAEASEAKLAELT
jgi:2-succinyl-5-enolpyruvyl-6-hydroxy-3-cyclohexene-1-carboxylate synthase